jgi:putative glutamine amidotransferase
LANLTIKEHKKMPQQSTSPIIGIITYGRNNQNQYFVTATYVESVRAAGGVPILLPPGEAKPEVVLSLVDGLIFVGGGDIDPTYFGGASHPTVYGIDLERDEFELALARHCFDDPTPVLGICRGAQVLTVASGGDLIIDIPSEVGEALKHAGHPVRPRHLVKIEEDSQLAQIVGAANISVTSSHHQAAREVPAGWRLAATAPDDVIEAIEYEAHPWMIAVQWHPEMDPDDRHHQLIFEALVEAARARMGRNKKG